MYSNLPDFFNDWQEESQLTLSVFTKIDEAAKSVKIKDNLRSLDRLAWHITQTLTEMPFRAGILESDVLENEPVPESIKKISEIYQYQSNILAETLKANWQDTDLTEIIEVYGEKWEKRKILSMLIKHQIHHRGQMTAMMRMLEMQVPGTYGPSKEEWTQYGMSPQE